VLGTLPGLIAIMYGPVNYQKGLEWATRTGHTDSHETSTDRRKCLTLAGCGA